MIASADEWLLMRGLLNRFVHEYIESPDDLAIALERACLFSDRMHTDYEAIGAYVKTLAL